MDVLKNAVIHSLEKDAHDSMTTIRHAPATLDVNDRMVVQLARQLAELVGKDGNAVLWGQFAAANRQGEFPASARALMAGNFESSAFMSLSKAAMEELRSQAERKTGATGGHIFFGQYRTNGSEFLLVAMIKQKGAITLSPDLRPTEIKEIDMSKLHQAARINLTRYGLHLEDNGNDPVDGVTPPILFDEKTYLCFVNRRGREEVADYFVDALGCVKGTSSSQLTNKLLKSVKQYVRDVPEIADTFVEVKQGVVDYLQALPENHPVKLDEVIYAARARVDPIRAAHFNMLKEFLNSEECQIPDEFQLSRQALRAHIRISAKKPNWGLWFETGVVGVTNAELLYDPHQKTLTLTDLPTETVNSVESALRARGQMTLTDLPMETVDSVESALSVRGQM
ncbi:nucleoid-associated protein [Dyella choica]|uniref:Nucleoid-associated protein n=1 Tax=Dyella choica TaxID=1927959 RepID=A0A3S0PIA2_9GAMM|nr:nucleoid-associated protein [Dyella choica]RUL68721.1 nucleoid-associated protein [Dyella choica]